MLEESHTLKNDLHFSLHAEASLMYETVAPDSQGFGASRRLEAATRSEEVWMRRAILRALEAHDGCSEVPGD